MSVSAVLIRISTGEVIKHANYPKAEITPVDGLDPDLRWLIKHTPFEQPDYDSRVFKLIRTEDITNEPHPVYPLLEMYKITFATEKRTDEEIQSSIENVESDATNNIVTYDKLNKLLLLGLAVLFRNVDGQTLNPKEQVIKDRVVAVGTKVWKNDAELRLKIQQLANGEEPNIDDGWERSE